MIRRLQLQDGTPCDASKYEFCGVALDVPVGDRKANEGMCSLRGWWIQDPTTGAPDKDRGIRVGTGWDDETVLAPLKDKVEQAGAAKQAADARLNDPKIKADKKAYEAAFAASNARNVELNLALEAVTKCEQTLQTIRRIHNQIALKEFQGIPVRMTLRRPGVDDEIVIVDSSGP